MDYRTSLCSVEHETCDRELDSVLTPAHSDGMDSVYVSGRNMGHVARGSGAFRWGGSRHLRVGWCLAGCLVLACDGGQTGDELDHDDDQQDVTWELRGTAQRLRAAAPEDGGPPADNDDFAWRIFALEAEPAKNLVLSPYSISVATAMLSAGAQGDTLSEIRTALGFSSEGKAFHAGHNWLLQSLEARNREGTETTNAQLLELSNDLWLLPELTPSDEFLDILSANYDVGVQMTRFADFPEESRQAINAKVAEDTRQLIDELLPRDSIDPQTLCVLTNAIYFKASWAHKFEKSATEVLPFETSSGQGVDVPLMRNSSMMVSYQVSSDLTAVALPYSGDELELVAIMPAPGTFEAFVQDLDDHRIHSIREALEPGPIDLRFPKFEIKSEIPLKERLIALGMELAFTSQADFDLIDEGIYVESAFHDATIILDEEGTEAAAATAFVMAGQGVSADPRELIFDHPFVFLVRDIPTNTTLFVGQLVDPG